MKFLKLFFLTFSLFLFTSIVAYSQVNPHEIEVAPTTGSTFLNDAIAGDTLPNGARVDSLRVYILVRDGMYLVNTPIRNTGWKLTIKAKAGTGKRPVVYLYPNSVTTLPPGQMVNIQGDLEIRDLVICGYFELIPSYLGGLQGALFNTTAAGKNITIDNCLLTNINGNHIRTDQATKNIKVTNTVFANMGYLGRSNLGAGKGLDLRAGSCDTLIVQNCTFVNWQDRVIRHFQSTAPIKFMRFDHNTLVNGMSYHGLLSLGKVGSRVEITNNLLYDAFALGNDTDAVRQSEFTDSGEKDAYGGARMTWVITEPTTTTEFFIKNNIYVVSSAGQAWYNQYAAAGVTGEGSPLTWNISKAMGADSLTAFVKHNLVLNSIPALMTVFMDWYRRPASQGGAGKTKTTSNWSAQYDFDRKDIPWLLDNFDCKYPTTAPAYTYAQGGFPVGDLNWFPARKSAWEIWSATDVSENNNHPFNFSLSQNYPNPFNPETVIEFSLHKNSNVKLVIYDALGRVIEKLVDDYMPAGIHKFSYNASKLSSGMYLYTLSAGGNSITKKMSVIK